MDVRSRRRPHHVPHADQPARDDAAGDMRRRVEVSDGFHSPLVAQLAQPREHGLGIGLLRQLRKIFAQACRHARARQAHERIDLLLLGQRGDDGSGRVLPRHLGQQLFGRRVVRLARQREAQVVFDVVVARVDARVVGQFGELVHERVEHVVDVAAVVHVAGAGVEQRVAREQRGLVGVRAQADVAHRVARRIHAFKLHALAHLDHVARLHAAVHTADEPGRVVVRNHLRAGGGNHRCIPANVVVVFVRVEDLRDLPALHARGGQRLLAVERVDGQRLARLRARDQVVEIAQRVAGPDSLDDHVARLQCGQIAALYPIANRALLLQLAPALFVQLDVVLFRCGLDALPRGVALGVADVFHLVEACHGIAHVAGIFQGLLALFFESKLSSGQIVAIALVELGHRLLLGWQVAGSTARNAGEFRGWLGLDQLIRTQGRHNLRPAHIHFMIHKAGYKTQFSQLYSADDPNLESDVQFAVTAALIGHYEAHESENEPAPDADVKGRWHSLQQGLW
jgi:hypothetical protein